MPDPTAHAAPAAPFSAATRAAHWNALGDRPFDLLVVGGGITGVGVAHDAALRGLRVALVEAGDFASGTSSRSSRLIHGGLRYLETFRFKLVFEALAERRRLLELAPHLVRPLPFLYPLYAGSGVGMLTLAAGMWMYDALSLFQTIQRHRMLSRRAALEREPGLQPEGLLGGAVYYDAQVDDARLTLAVARAAHRAGATLLSHAPVHAFVRDERGQVAGVAVRDARTGAQGELRARLVVAAAGPWTDELRRLLDPAARPRLRPTKGVHIQLSRERVGNRGGITIRSPIDGRVMFALPWGDYSYVGTTDTDYTGSPASAEADRDDVQYLLDSLNAIFPGAHATRDDVLSSWTGVRPLVAPAEAEGRISASDTSREHEIWREPGGVLFVAGGKLTTFRVMAADVAESAARILEREHGLRPGASRTATARLPGAPAGEWGAFQERATRDGERVGLAREVARRLAATYGADAPAIHALVEADRALAAPIAEGRPECWAEVVHAARDEMALTLEDVLRRRLHLFYDLADGGVSVAPAVAARLAIEGGLGWSEDEISTQVAAYAEAVHRTRAAL